MTTFSEARYGITFGYVPGDSGWGSSFNLMVKTLGAMLCAYVTSDTLSAPPSSPAEGDTYIVKATGTGAWASHDGKIAAYQGGAWQFYTAPKGFRAYLLNHTAFYWYDGSSWTAEVTSGTGGGTVGSDGSASFFTATGFSSSNYVTFGALANLGTGDFTIEGWLNPSSTTGYKTILDGSATTFAGLLIHDGGLCLFSEGAIQLTQTGVATGSDQHFALVRHGGTARIYLNGESTSSTSDSRNYTFGSTNFIGAGSDGSHSNPYSGSISNFKINNTAVYTADFDVPDRPLASDSSTELLTFQDSTIIDNSPDVNTLGVVGTVTMKAVVTFPWVALLPTSDPHVANTLWNNSGVMTISAG